MGLGPRSPWQRRRRGGPTARPARLPRRVPPALAPVRARCRHRPHHVFAQRPLGVDAGLPTGRDPAPCPTAESLAPTGVRPGPHAQSQACPRPGPAVRAAGSGSASSWKSREVLGRFNLPAGGWGPVAPVSLRSPRPLGRAAVDTGHCLVPRTASRPGGGAERAISYLPCDARQRRRAQTGPCGCACGQRPRRRS